MLAQRQSRPMSLFSEPDESQLVRMACADISAFAPLYEKYFSRIYAYCLRRVENQHDAEDLTSSIFIQAVANLARFRGGSFAAWLFQIAHNAVINQRRTKFTQISLDSDQFEIPTTAPEPIDTLIADEQQALLKKLLNTLPEEQQDLLALKLVGELSSKEIGAVVGKSANAVRVELHRIIKQLREQYWQEEETHE